MDAENMTGMKEMLALISASVHDMKTPLTSIVGFADALLDGTVPEEKREHYLRVIRDEAKRMGGLCEELLDASRIESGTKKYEMKPFDICESARRVIISLEQAIEKKRLDVSFEAEADSITALGDENAIDRVLYNICDNAVKFSYEGGCLSVSISYCGDMTNVRIRNEGQAMEEEELSQVFVPFYRKGEGCGTGLGMYIAKNIIDAHGGAIEAESKAGEGTAFSFRIFRG